MPTFELTENPDILKKLSEPSPNRADLVIGFAAETEDVIEHAQAKRAHKQCDWIVANDVSPKGNVFGNDQTTVHIITNTTVETHQNVSKKAASFALMEKIAQTLNPSQAAAE